MKLGQARIPALWVVVGIGLGVVGTVSFVLLGSIFALAEGQYSARERLTSTSPDGRYQAVVYTRVAFPSMDLLDPELLIRITLTDRQTGERVDGVELTLMEESDFGEPRAEWSGNGVRISSLERWHDITALLRADTWTGSK